jgi:hypothetical protein
MRATYGERHVRVAAIISMMADLARTEHRWHDAETLIERARTLFKETVGEEHEFYLHQLSSLGWVRSGQGRYTEAVQLLQPAAKGLDAVVPQSRYAGLAHVWLAAALAGVANRDAAEREAREGYEILRKVTGAESVELKEASSVLAGLEAK